MITKNIGSENIRVDNGSIFAGEYSQLCKTEGIKNYSTMSETKAAIAERSIRSLKNILQRNKEDYGYKYIHKVAQFVTTLYFTRNCSIYLIP